MPLLLFECSLELAPSIHCIFLNSSILFVFRFYNFSCVISSVLFLVLQYFDLRGVGQWEIGAGDHAQYILQLLHGGDVPSAEEQSQIVNHSVEWGVAELLRSNPNLCVVHQRVVLNVRDLDSLNTVILVSEYNKSDSLLIFGSI